VAQELGPAPLFFDYPHDVKRIIYTTNAIESVNMSLRKITKNRGAFPSDEALLKLFYLALNNIAKKWAMPVQNLDKGCRPN
jgi:putative transposase